MLERVEGAAEVLSVGEGGGSQFDQDGGAESGGVEGDCEPKV